MRPFLLLATRPEDHLALAERDAIRRFAGLGEGDLHHHRLERDPLPPIDLDEWSGIIVGGSPFNTSDTDKSAVQVRVEGELGALLDEVVDRDFPFLGACYGVGTLGVHRGGVVDRTYGEEAGAVPVTLTPTGRADPLFVGFPDTFEAYVGHKEAVARLPEDAVLLASSPACPVQAFRVGANVYATQFHPELDAAGIVDRVTTYREDGYFPADEFDAVVARLRAADATHPPRLLANFARRYAR